jgi:hypothetical protein
MKMRRIRERKRVGDLELLLFSPGLLGFEYWLKCSVFQKAGVKQNFMVA